MFSYQSRMRMIKMVNMVDWKSVPGTMFLTLTFPDECVTNGLDIERQRAEFFRRVFREYGHWAVLWRVEWEPRKTGEHTGQFFPHLHMLIPGAPFMRVELLREEWQKVLKTERSVQIYAKWIVDTRQVMYYVSKYVAKVHNIDELGMLDVLTYSRICGRHWGILKRGLMPWAAVVTMKTTDMRVLRQLHDEAKRHWAGVPDNEATGFTVFTEDAYEMIERAKKLDADIWDEYNTDNL